MCAALISYIKYLASPIYDQQRLLTEKAKRKIYHFSLMIKIYLCTLKLITRTNMKRT